MARTVGDCLFEAREILQDTIQPYRYGDESLCAILTTAIREARRLRPDLFVESLFSPLPIVTATDLAAPFPMTEMYWAATVNYIVGRAELRDDQFNADGRASAMLASFKAQLSTALA